MRRVGRSTINFALALIAAIVVAQPSTFAQVGATVETRYRIAGVETFEAVGPIILADETAKPTLEPVGFVCVESDAKIVRVKAEDAKRAPVETFEVEPGKFLILGRGRIWVEITCVDFETQVFDEDEIVIEVGDIEPLPVPDDEDEDEGDDTKPDEDDVDPAGESPFAESGLRALIVYEFDEMSTYTKQQSNVLYSQTLRKWALYNCAKSPSGSTEFRVFDKDTEGQHNTWTQALSRPRDSLPWLLVGNGDTGYEGPLPKDVTPEDVIAILERFKK